jgi:8-oxo-dGTP diphosphatase
MGDGPTQYVLGFLFDPSQKDVVLIKKLKPEWQKGKLNGVGGKIEEGESA